MKYFVILALFLAFPVNANPDDIAIEKFAENHISALNSSSPEALEALYYDTWSKCKDPKHNASMKSYYVELISEMDLSNGYEYDLLPIKKSPQQKKEKLESYFGVPDAEYYPVDPSHRLMLTEKTLRSVTHGLPVKKINGKWYLMHTCAGRGMDEYLEKVKKYENEDQVEVFDFSLNDLLETPSNGDVE